jgi:hypothetical protein
MSMDHFIRTYDLKFLLRVVKISAAQVLKEARRAPCYFRGQTVYFLNSEIEKEPEH